MYVCVSALREYNIMQIVLWRTLIGGMQDAISFFQYLQRSLQGKGEIQVIFCQGSLDTETVMLRQERWFIEWHKDIMITKKETTGKLQEGPESESD